MKLVRKLSLAALTPLAALGVAAAFAPAESAAGAAGEPAGWVAEVICRAAILFG